MFIDGFYSFPCLYVFTIHAVKKDWLKSKLNVVFIVLIYTTAVSYALKTWKDPIKLETVNNYFYLFKF